MRSFKYSIHFKIMIKNMIIYEVWTLTEWVNSCDTCIVNQ